MLSGIRQRYQDLLICPDSRLEVSKFEVSKRTVSFLDEDSLNVWTKLRTMIAEPVKPMARTSAEPHRRESMIEKALAPIILERIEFARSRWAQNARGGFSRITCLWYGGCGG
jgi:hypothetical protein